MNRRTFLWGLAALGAPIVRAADAPTILLLYPQLPDPERTLFREILGSFTEQAHRSRARILEVPISAQANAAEIEQLRAREHPELAVALGRAAIALVEGLRPPLPLIAGAADLPVPTPGVSGISLVASRARVLSTLVGIAPPIRSVSVVLDAVRDAWLRPHIEQAARALSLRLDLSSAANIAEAGARYLEQLQHADPASQALWLLNQPQFLTPDILPRLIEEAWTRSIVVFSDVLEHVNEGALFAPYLDARSLGRRLARLVLDPPGALPPIVMDNAPERAINVRTARHLAHVVDLTKISEFDLVLGRH